ncbi:P-loop ATPase, Sll1717 family [Streptomyces sp. NPDC008079]|uniref:P-loop ATPase, Sll1717 family n=1 Tax=Streptomyces sp. NPDC008079 TaxID=3364806 RepID=UPI0036E10C5C
MAVSSTFKQFDFGYADSGSEFSIAPRLLRDGYYDLDGIEEKVVDSHEFLLLGYKGSGKSAIGARLQVRAEGAPSQFAAHDPILVDSLPLKEFKGIVPDSIDAHLRHRFAWMLQLMVQITSGINDDGQADAKSRKRIAAACRQLAKHGVTAQNPATMKKFRAEKVTATAGLPEGAIGLPANIKAEFQRNTDASRISDWVDYLQTETAGFKSQRRHYFFVDGLDDLSLIQEGRKEMLGGLIQAVVDLNKMYREAGAPIKVVICCRTDLYARLELTRGGKIQSDYGLDLNWYQNPRDFRVSHLVKLANMRARLADRSSSNVFDEYFEPRIDSDAAIDFILKQTRHTPRDLLQLLKIIQKHVGASGVIPNDSTKAGIAEYSQTYFIGEMRDALSAYFDQDQITAIATLLGTLRRRQVSYGELEAKMESDPRFRERFDLHKAIAALFDNSFIGNLTEGGPVSAYDQYYRFKFRNPHAALAVEDKLVVHPGLWKAFSIA